MAGVLWPDPRTRGPPVAAVRTTPTSRQQPHPPSCCSWRSRVRSGARGLNLEATGQAAPGGSSPISASGHPAPWLPAPPSTVGRSPPSLSPLWSPRPTQVSRIMCLFQAQPLDDLRPQLPSDRSPRITSSCREEGVAIGRVLLSRPQGSLRPELLLHPPEGKPALEEKGTVTSPGPAPRPGLSQQRKLHLVVSQVGRSEPSTPRGRSPRCGGAW